MPNALSPVRQDGPEGWAEVRAHDRVVRYRRSGTGRPVLLLQPNAPTAPLWPELLDLICRGSRLIVPDPPANELEAEAWLSALLDGLGMRNITVVAAGGFWIAALERALLSPEQIAAVVLIYSGRGTESAVEGKLTTPAQPGTVPLVVLRRDREVSEILPVVEALLHGR